MKLVFATNNKNKIKEIKSLLPESIEILSLIDIGCTEEIEETESTLEGNAQLKANYITKNYGYNCFADDTGLEVESLKGAPGVYSARHAGNQASSEDNMRKLLNELQNIENRNAQFRTIIALNIDKNKYSFEGVCKGDILKERQGNDGFGYDPIFRPKGFIQSFAEMSLEQKGKISHRGLAVAELVAFFKSRNLSDDY